MTVKFKINDSKFGRKIKKVSDVPDRVMDDAFKFFKNKTPIRTGNARKNTRKRGSSIQANYDYADRLDNGYSRQAPRGMTKPTIEYIKKRLTRYLRRRWRG